MALRAPLPDDQLDARPNRRHLRIVRPEEVAAAEGERADAPARGVLIGLALVIAGFWAPFAATVAYLFSR